MTRDDNRSKTSVVKNISDLAGSSVTGAMDPIEAGEIGF
jgi:hypothetical protein